MAGSTVPYGPRISLEAGFLTDPLGLTPDMLGGRLVLVNGPASLPVACVLAHYLAHRFGAVAVYDPKLGSYVVSITHDPEYPLGALIPA